MAEGLQVWDESNNLILDLADRLTRRVGVVNTGTTAGSVNVPEFSDGTGEPFWIVLPLSSTLNNLPTVTRSGNTLSWNFASGTSAQAALIYYGLY